MAVVLGRPPFRRPGIDSPASRRYSSRPRERGTRRASRRRDAVIELILYEKAHCSLCDAAREVVEDVQDALAGSVPTTLARVDIREDPMLFERFRYDVPVLAIDGRPAFRHRVEFERLRARLVSGTPAPLEPGAPELP